MVTRILVVLGISVGLTEHAYCLSYRGFLLVRKNGLAYGITVWIKVATQVCCLQIREGGRGEAGKAFGPYHLWWNYMMNKHYILERVYTYLAMSRQGFIRAVAIRSYCT